MHAECIALRWFIWIFFSLHTNQRSLSIRQHDQSQTTRIAWIVMNVKYVNAPAMWRVNFVVMNASHHTYERVSLSLSLSRVASLRGLLFGRFMFTTFDAAYASSLRTYDACAYVKQRAHTSSNQAHSLPSTCSPIDTNNTSSEMKERKKKKNTLKRAPGEYESNVISLLHSFDRCCSVLTCLYRRYVK